MRAPSTIERAFFQVRNPHSQVSAFHLEGRNAPLLCMPPPVPPAPPTRTKRTRHHTATQFNLDGDCGVSEIIQCYKGSEQRSICDTDRTPTLAATGRLVPSNDTNGMSSSKIPLILKGDLFRNIPCILTFCAETLLIQARRGRHLSFQHNQCNRPSCYSSAGKEGQSHRQISNTLSSKVPIYEQNKDPC